MMSKLVVVAAIAVQAIQFVTGDQVIELAEVVVVPPQATQTPVLSV